MPYNLTTECLEILEAARATGGSINIVETDSAEWVRAGSRSFIGDPPDRQTMRRYRDALHFLAEAGFVEYRRGTWYELTTKGWLGDLSELSVADVSGDYLDMAEHLDSKGYHLPAAMVAGAVLEDFLRKLHITRIGPWQGDSSIGRLNEGLRKAGVYEQPVWRQIQVWGDIRNPADHGHFDKVDAGQVKLMVQWIREFIAKHEG